MLSLLHLLPAISVAATVTSVAVATTAASTTATATTAIAATTTVATTTAVAAATAIAIAALRRARRPLLLETITAIDRAIFAWDKRNRGWITAVRADGFVLLTAWAWAGGPTAAIAARLAAIGATTGGIRQAFSCEKFLLTGSKCEFLSTIATGKDTVLVSLIGRHG
jgi:hypothetical protein